MALQTVKIGKSAAADAPVSKGRKSPGVLGLGLGLGLFVVRSLFRRKSTGKEAQMQPVDLNKLVEPFLDTGLYLAVTKDKSSVVATGKTIRDAMNSAADEGCAEPVIMRAPSRQAMQNSLHL